MRRRRRKTAGEIAGIIERFLNGTSRYPQEWNDFHECGLPDADLDKYRKRCDLLDHLVNSPEPQDSDAMAELRRMIEELRQIENSNTRATKSPNSTD
jgi:hypothetical protein